MYLRVRAAIGRDRDLRDVNVTMKVCDHILVYARAFFAYWDNFPR